MRLDVEGRLMEFFAVPPQKIRIDVLEGEPDWGPLFEAAGLDRGNLAAVASEWTPPSYANWRGAWEGVYPDATETPIRIEAAACGELPVAFRIIEPWTQSRDVEVDTRGLLERAGDLVNAAVFVAALAGAAVLAVRNLRLGRGDRKTALRFALYAGASALVSALVLVPLAAPRGGPLSVSGRWWTPAAA